MLEIYQGRRVLVTGATGFKGSWLMKWLGKLDADVAGISLMPPSDPSHYNLLGLDKKKSFICDIQDYNATRYVFNEHQPEIVFHLAASAIVAKTFDEPRETFINNISTATNILEACRVTKSVKALVIITTDKVYKNNEWNWAYRENDSLGGDDPYSSSKVCIEEIIKCYRQHFFPMIATARAGNVICGGDWGAYRLIPDIIRATSKGETVIIKTPEATRPWQHVLEPLYGYLLLGEKLLRGETQYATNWNFGPSTGEMTVLEILKTAQKSWPEIKYEVVPQMTHPSMVTLLKIDSTESKKKLGWETIWPMERSVLETIDWYFEYYKNGNVITDRQINDYMGERKV